MNNIILYVKTGCLWSEGVMELLRENGLEFEERNVFEKEENFHELMEKTGQHNVPTIEVQGEFLIDTDRDQVEEFLIGKGILKK